VFRLLFIIEENRIGFGMDDVGLSKVENIFHSAANKNVTKMKQNSPISCDLFPPEK
jgi:hypothetical protein